MYCIEVEMPGLGRGGYVSGMTPRPSYCLHLRHAARWDSYRAAARAAASLPTERDAAVVRIVSETPTPDGRP